jgi:phage terminase large subunit
VTKTHIRCRNGSEFIFSGIKNNVKKIKSMEDVDVCLCEEAEAITEESWKVLTPTIRAPGSEIWVIFNPYDEMDATYTRYITPWEDALRDEGHYEDSQIAVQCMNYPDNPWFPEELRLEMEKMKEEHYIDYLHVWLGQAVGASENAIISPLWIKAAVDAHLHIGFKPRGIKCVGFDPADEGADSKALCVRHGSVVIECESWYSGDVSDAIDRAFDKAYEIRATDLVYDQVGVGAAVKHHINQIEGRDGFTTSGFLGNDIPEDPAALYMDDRRMDDVFRNRRAQAFWFLRDRFEKTYKVIEKGEYIDPAELISLSSEMEGLTQLKSELSRIERKRKASYKDVIQLESKKEMKDRGLKSPGLADSLMYAFSNPPKTKGWDKPINYGKSGNI